MAHNVETMAYVGTVPWHGLGKPCHKNMTPKQMQVASGTNWMVEKVPLYGDDYVTRNGVLVPIVSDKAALVRDSDGKVLDTVSLDWEPIQNEDAFEFFHDMVEAGGMEMHTAGSLRGGQIVWVLAKTKESFKIFKGDEIDSYLLFTNYHKYGVCADVRHTPIRVVCNNTLTMALSKKGDRPVKINHRSEFKAEEVQSELGLAREQMTQYREMAQFLGEKRYTKAELNTYFDLVFPSTAKPKKDVVPKPSANAERARELVEASPGHKFAPGSWWNAFNAVTFMTDHELARSDAGRLESAWYGANRKLKTDALHKAVEFAKAA